MQYVPGCLVSPCTFVRPHLPYLLARHAVDAQALRERDASGAQAESLAAQLSSKARECDAFAAALAAEQRRVDELQMVRANREGDPDPGRETQGGRPERETQKGDPGRETRTTPRKSADKC